MDNRPLRFEEWDMMRPAIGGRVFGDAEGAWEAERKRRACSSSR